MHLRGTTADAPVRNPSRNNTEEVAFVVAARRNVVNDGGRMLVVGRRALFRLAGWCTNTGSKRSPRGLVYANKKSLAQVLRALGNRIGTWRGGCGGTVEFYATPPNTA